MVPLPPEMVAGFTTRSASAKANVLQRDVITQINSFFIFFGFIIILFHTLWLQIYEKVPKLPNVSGLFIIKKIKKRYFTALNYGLSLPYYDFLTIPDEYTLAGSIDSLAI